MQPYTDRLASVLAQYSQGRVRDVAVWKYGKTASCRWNENSAGNRAEEGGG